MKIKTYKFTASLLGLFIALIFAVSCKHNTDSIPVPAAKVEEPIKTDQLSAWADAPKKRITDWVIAVTDSNSADFIPVEDRIAVFDNDGTLWPEQPMPNQLQYAIDYLKQNASSHPEWQKDPIIKGLIEDNMEPLKKAGKKGLASIVTASHTNRMGDEFKASVKQWVNNTKDKKFNEPYAKILYLPMLQLLDYLRENQFKTFIVSGGGADFMRAFAEEAYGIPPYQVVGSYGEVKYDVVEGKPMIKKVGGNFFVDDSDGKPEGIYRFIGKKPVLCGGNSDGDQAMMQYTSSSPYKSLCIILHHTDAEREYEYDTKTLSGHLETALDEAKEKNWMVIDMKNDFKKIFSFQ